MKRRSEEADLNLSKRQRTCQSDGLLQQGIVLCKYPDRRQKSFGISLIKKSAELGNGDACAILGDFYRKIDLKDEVIKYYNMGVELNNSNCLFNLASVYHLGLYGLEKDYDKITNYWIRAYEMGNLMAGYNYVQYLYENKIEGHEELVVKILHDLAEKGLDQACYKLGVIYKKGILVEKNLTKARDFFRTGAQLGHGESMLSLSGMCFYGEGGEVNKPMASIYYKYLADKTGHAVASFNYATMLLTGDGNKQDFHEAIKYLSASVEKEYPSACHALALQLMEGKNIKQDKKRARQLYKKAGKKDHAKSLFQLARIYENGDGTEKNISKAVIYHKLAVLKGAPQQPFISFLSTKIQSEKTYSD